MPRLIPIHYRKLVKVFENIGFVHARTEGDHMVYNKEGVLRPVIIPKYKEIPEFIIIKNIKTAGITRSQYLELLKKA